MSAAVAVVAAGPGVLDDVEAAGAGEDDVEAVEEEDDGDEEEDDDDYDDDTSDIGADVAREAIEARKNGDKTTHKTYMGAQKEWGEYWEKQGKSSAVTKNKTAVFIQYLMSREKKKGKEVDGELLRFKAVSGALSAIIDLWSQQEFESVLYKGRVCQRGTEHPRTRTVRQLLKKVKDRESFEAQRLGLDTSVTNLSNGFDDIAQVKDISAQLLQTNKHTAFRTRMQCLVSHGTLGRGDDMRKIRLWNLYTWTAEGVGPTPCRFLMLGLPGHHTRKSAGSAPYLSVIRHKDPLLCGVGSVALYLFFRFSALANQPILDFETRASWSGTVLLENTRAHDIKGLARKIAASTTRAQLKEILMLNNVKSTKVEHIFRLWSQQHAKMMGQGRMDAGELDEHGGWGSRQGVRQTHYSPTPPIQASLVLGHYGKGIEWETDHNLNRAEFDSPLEEELTAAIFPWATAWIEARAEGAAEMADGSILEGNSLQFCKTLRWLAQVLIQDAPFLQAAAPSMRVWTLEPFNTAAFEQYAARMIEFCSPPSRALVVAHSPSRVDEATNLVESSPLRRALVAVVDETRSLVASLDVRFERVATAAAGQAISTASNNGHGASTNANIAQASVLLAATTDPEMTIRAAGRAAEGMNEAVAVLRRRNIANSGPFHLSTTLSTVASVWEEYSRGLSGMSQPSIQDIVKRHGVQWQWQGREKGDAVHKKEAEAIRGLRAKRKLVWDEIERIERTTDSATSDDAAVTLQRRFESYMRDNAASKPKTSLSTFTLLLRTEACDRGDRKARENMVGKKKQRRQIPK